MTPPGTHPPLTQPGADAPPDVSLDAQIDALLADPPAGAPPKTGADAEAAVASIERQVESLVDQFVEQSEPAQAEQPAHTPAAQVTAQPEASAPPVAVPDSIGELDDQLARLTDELLTAPAPEPYQAPSVKFAPTPESPAIPAPPEPALQPAPAAVPIAPAAHAEPGASTPSPIAPPPVAVPPAGPGAVVRIFSRPLAGKPRIVRDTVGWLGFNSLFLASVVWAYHLWIQKPEKLEAQHAPAALVSSDGHGEAAHGSPEAHAAATAPAPHASNNHAPPDEHAAAPEHGAEEPLTGVQPLHRKKPTYALSAAMAERLNVAKKSSDGHGGGGHGAEKKSGSGHGAPAKSGH